MASLIEQLQADALERSVPITDLLRKAKIAAVKLGSADFAAWIERETAGYVHGEDVPPYRKLYAEFKFRNPVRGWCPIVPGGHERIIRQSIGEISALLDGPSDASFGMSVGPEVIAAVSKDLGFNVDVKSWVSRAALENIVEAVRDAVLDWALKLEAAGVRGDKLSFSAVETARAQSVSIHIGSIGHATGLGAFGDHATITATQTVSVAALASGIRTLADEIDSQLGSLPRNLLEPVKVALAELRKEASAKKPDEGRMRQGLQSLGRIMEGAAGNLAAAGVIAGIAKLVGGG